MVHSMPKDILDNIPFSRIDASPVHGHGLFAEKDLPAGMLLVVLDGQIVPWSLYETRQLASEWNALPDDRLLVRPYRTKYFCINHARQPNLKIRRDDREDHVAVFTLTDIPAGHEMFLDYRDEPLPQSYLQGHGEAYL